MDKPEDIPQWAWDEASKCVPNYVKRTIVGGIARAILSAQSQAYMDAARIACLKSRDAQYIANRLRDFFDEPGHSRRLALDAAMMIEHLNSDRISSAILQRKEEIGRN